MHEVCTGAPAVVGKPLTWDNGALDNDAGSRSAFSHRVSVRGAAKAGVKWPFVMGVSGNMNNQG